MKRLTLIASGTTLLLILAGCAGNDYVEPRTEVEVTQTQSQDLEMAVGESFQNFVSSLLSYTQIQPDVEDPLSRFDETEAAFLSLRSNYLDFKQILSQVTTQEELGQNGPQLAKMQALIAFADRYMSSQEDFYSAVGECADLPGGLSAPDCDFENLLLLEVNARQTITPFVEAMDEVMASIPQRGN